MPKWIVIADDLMGSSLAGQRLAQSGWRSLSALSLSPWEARALPHDAVLFATESGKAAPGRAFRRTYAISAAARRLQAGVAVLVCGPVLAASLGAAIDGVLDALGPGWLCVLAPAAPGAGTAVYGGRLLQRPSVRRAAEAVPGGAAAVGATRSEDAPVELAAALAGVCRRRVGLLPLDTVIQGERGIAATLRQLAERGVEVVIADAVGADDLAALAAGMAESGLRIVPAASLDGLAAWARATAAVHGDGGPPPSADPAHRAGVLLGAALSRVNTDPQGDPGTLVPIPAVELRKLAQAAMSFGAPSQAGAIHDGVLEGVAHALARSSRVWLLPSEADLAGASGPAAPVAEEADSSVQAGLAALVSLVVARHRPSLGTLHLVGSGLAAAALRRLHGRAIEWLHTPQAPAALGRLMGGWAQGLTVSISGGA